VVVAATLAVFGASGTLVVHDFSLFFLFPWRGTVGAVGSGCNRMCVSLYNASCYCFHVVYFSSLEMCGMYRSKSKDKTRSAWVDAGNDVTAIVFAETDGSV
jgi:hypothetical protein